MIPAVVIVPVDQPSPEEIESLPEWLQIAVLVFQASCILFTIVFMIWAVRKGRKETREWNAKRALYNERIAPSNKMPEPKYRWDGRRIS